MSWWPDNRKPSWPVVKALRCAIGRHDYKMVFRSHRAWSGEFKPMLVCYATDGWHFAGKVRCECGAERESSQEEFHIALGLLGLAWSSSTPVDRGFRWE